MRKSKVSKNFLEIKKDLDERAVELLRDVNEELKEKLSVTGTNVPEDILSLKEKIYEESKEIFKEEQQYLNEQLLKYKIIKEKSFLRKIIDYICVDIESRYVNNYKFI